MGSNLIGFQAKIIYSQGGFDLFGMKMGWPAYYIYRLIYSLTSKTQVLLLHWPTFFFNFLMYGGLQINFYPFILTNFQQYLKMKLRFDQQELISYCVPSRFTSTTQLAWLTSIGLRSIFFSFCFVLLRKGLSLKGN